jgi:hypothetical protein
LTGRIQCTPLVIIFFHPSSSSIQASFIAESPGIFWVYIFIIERLHTAEDDY